MEYLTRWRILLAGNRLKNSDDSLYAIALSLGYEPESAFGKAFRRVMGCSPRRYGQPCAPFDTLFEKKQKQLRQARRTGRD